MFPINANRLTVSQSTEFPASSNTSHLPKRIKSIQNISELSPHLTETKPVKRNRLKLKLNIEAATQATAFDKLAEKTRLLVNEKNIEYDTESRGQRYPNIGCAKCTQISILNKDWQRMLLSANRLQLNGDGLAIRCQYPKNDPQAIENHLIMLLENRVPLLVVLSSNNEFKPSFGSDSKLPAYFINSKKYGDIKVKSLRMRADYRVDRNSHLKGMQPLKFNQYKLEIKGRGKQHSLPVIHINNWGDGKTISTSELKKLSRMVGILTHGSLIKLKKYHGVAIDGKNRPLPVIHCKAGIGRTGVLAAGMQLTKKDNTLKVDDIVLGLRISGSADMIQTEAQYNTLLDLERLINTTRKASS